MLCVVVRATGSPQEPVEVLRNWSAMLSYLYTRPQHLLWKSTLWVLTGDSSSPPDSISDGYGTGHWISSSSQRDGSSSHPKLQTPPLELISLLLFFHLPFTVKCGFSPQHSNPSRESDRCSPSCPAFRAAGKGLTWEAGSMAHLVCSMKFWVAGERVSARRIDERVLKTPSIVLRSTLSAQNCTKHIQEGRKYAWGTRSKQKKNWYVSLK